MEIIYNIKEVEDIRLTEALELVWNVFQEFEATEYSDEGIQEFKSFIGEDSIRKKLSDGQFRMWICLYKNEVVGAIATRPPCHISLLFVDKRHHRKGIARALLNTTIDHYRTHTANPVEMTVNSSPYAVEIYHRMDFRDTGSELTVNGIRFTPMMRSL